MLLQTLDSPLAIDIARAMIDGFNRHYRLFRAESARARQLMGTVLLAEEGINLFYNSIESRHRCCQVRKLEPLKRAMQGLDVWICGLRKQQSVTRKDMQVVEWDDIHNLIKVNPLINWSEEDVEQYVKKHHVPYNKLQDKGYPSIGCQPCTRAIKPGEDIRAGRWWWESPEHRECGLHQRS